LRKNYYLKKNIIPPSSSLLGCVRVITKEEEHRREI